MGFGHKKKSKTALAPLRIHLPDVVVDFRKINCFIKMMECNLRGEMTITQRIKLKDLNLMNGLTKMLQISPPNVKI